MKVSVFFSLAYLCTSVLAADLPQLPKDVWRRLTEDIQQKAREQWVRSPMDEQGEWSQWLFASPPPPPSPALRSHSSNPCLSPAIIEEDFTPFFTGQTYSQRLPSPPKERALTPIYEGPDDTPNILAGGSSTSIPQASLSSKTRGNPRGRKASHDGTREHACDVCGKRFRRIEHKKRHLRSVHTEEKPFPCGVCGKFFSREDNCRQHLKIHNV